MMSERLQLQLDGFEGPMDLLLDLAQKQKFDLSRISILALVEQYLAIVQGAVRVRIELAADWLVMAAWLTWLKSRLLLPPDAQDGEGELAADVLAHRIQALQEIRAAAAWLDGRVQLGRDVFARGAPEEHTAFDRTGLAAKLPGLIRAYVAARRGAASAYAPARPVLWTVQDALQRLTALLGSPALRGWMALEQFLPDETGAERQRAALASTLLAGLELARDGRLELRQELAFAAIQCRAAP